MTFAKRRPNDEIPTSSMADIAFLLVIYFMLTVTFASSQGLDMSFPPENDEPVTVDPIESVLVEIRPDGELNVDGRPLPLDSLLSYLEPKLRQNPDKPVILRPHPQSAYGSMILVYDELRQAPDKLGLERGINIALPTEREIDIYWL